MSKVWRRLQRVGKTAYKFEFTIKVHTVTLECVSGWTPNQVSVLWVRRGRKVRTEATSWTTLPGKDTQGVVNWHALEATITLYMDTNSPKKKFDDKYWTLIVENIGPNGKHKALATRRINMSQMADPSLHPQETRRKYRMKPVARKVHLTELQVTFISKFERQGPAMFSLFECIHVTLIDDDMRSVTSEMSEMTFGGFEDGYMSENEYEPYNDANPEENEQIMKEIAAIGADFRQLSSFTDDAGPTSDPLKSINNNNNNACSGFQTNGMGSHEQILIAWARRETENYKDISVVDLKDSWGDGKAFCAIIHKYCPELIKMGQLNDPYSNVKQATKAAVELGLMPSIDPIDFHKRRLDKLSILTFVDQLYQNFKNAQPQAAPIMKHKEMKKSPEHKRTAPSVISNRKVELDETEEDKRRKDMIARGRLRASRRRPNRLNQSDNSLNSSKSPIPTPISELQSSQTNSTPTTPAPPVSTTPAAPVEPVSGVQGEQGSVTGSSGIITDSPTHLVKCNVTSSFEADVFVSSSGLDPDELMKEFQRQSPAVSRQVTENDVNKEELEVEKNEPEVADQEVIDALVGSAPGSERSLDLMAGSQLYQEIMATSKPGHESEISGSDSKLSAPSEKASVKSENSADAILQSLERDVIQSPSSIRISGITSEEPAVDPSTLAIKLSESKDEAAAFREAILSGEDEPAEEVISHGPAVEDEQSEPEPVVDDMKSDFDELIKMKFSLEEPDEPAPKLEDPPQAAEEDSALKHIESDIEAEIAELESQLNSNFLFKSQPAVVKPPSPPPPREPSPVKEEVPAPPPAEPAPLQPTPPTTPPRSTRASSLRDKIRGLHSAREKLMSALPPPTISEDQDNKPKPPVLPKPALSREKIALLRSSSQESVKSRSSSKSDGAPSIPELQPEEVVSKPKQEIAIAAPKPSLDEVIIAQETPPESPETVHDDVVTQTVESLDDVSVTPEVALEQQPQTEIKETISPPEEPIVSPVVEAPEDPAVSPLEEVPVEAPPVVPVNLELECDLEHEEDEGLESPGEVVLPQVPLVVTTPEETSPEPVEDVTAEELPVVTPEEVEPEPQEIKPTPAPPSPRKPTGTEIQSLSELISSFSPKTEAETSAEETTTTEVAGAARAESPVEEEPAHESKDAVGLANNKDFGSSVSSINSEPPPPPAPEPLALMMGPPGEEEEDEDSLADEEEEVVAEPLNQSTLDKQDLQDVRDYMSECHARITHHNAKLDKRAKVLEKELRVAMDSQNHELEQKLLKSWLHLVHERNTLVRKQDDLNSLQNEEDLEERCCVVLKEMRKYQNMRDTNKTVHDVEREEQLEEEYREILKKREMLLRIRDDINTISMEEEAEFRSVIEKPKLLQDQSSCKVS